MRAATVHMGIGSLWRLIFWSADDRRRSHAERVPGPSRSAGEWSGINSESTFVVARRHGHRLRDGDVAIRRAQGFCQWSRRTRVAEMSASDGALNEVGGRSRCRRPARSRRSAKVGYRCSLMIRRPTNIGCAMTAHDCAQVRFLHGSEELETGDRVPVGVVAGHRCRGREVKLRPDADGDCATGPYPSMSAELATQ
jgi:hypothetical protein